MIYFNDEVKEYNIGHLFDKKHDFKVLSNTTGLFEQVVNSKNDCEKSSK